MSLATRPTSPLGVAELRRPDPLDDGVWSLLSQDAEEASPVKQAEAVDQAGRTVAEDGRSLQAIEGNGIGQGVLGRGGIGAGDPEAVWMVAVAALLRDQFSEAAVMVGGAGGVLMHGAVLDSGDALQAIIGKDPDTGWLLQQEAASVVAAAVLDPASTPPQASSKGQVRAITSGS